MNYTGSVRHGVVIRLAELYLIAAEAELFLNDNASGTSYINEVRRRAAIPGKEAAMKIKPEQLTLDFILDERARELGGEQQRWFDLKRTGKLLERVKAYNPDAKVNIKEHHCYVLFLRLNWMPLSIKKSSGKMPVTIKCACQAEV